MTPTELKRYLEQVVQRSLKLSVMIWGAPRIGKSSIVAQVAEARVEQRWKVVECNCFNGSRFYLADVARIVRVVSAYQE